MGKLLTHDGGRGTEPGQYGHSEWGTDGQTINKVVQRVAQTYHPRHRLDAGDLFPSQPVARHLWPLIFLKEGPLDLDLNKTVTKTLIRMRWQTDSRYHHRNQACPHWSHKQ